MPCTSSSTALRDDDFPAHLGALLLLGRTRRQERREAEQLVADLERRDREAIGALVGHEWALISEFSRVEYSGHLAYLTVEIHGCTPIQALFQRGESWQWLRWAQLDGARLVAGEGAPDRWRVYQQRRGIVGEYGHLDEAVAVAREAYLKGAR